MVCTTKSLGGLGLRSLKETNVVHLAKLAWHFMNQPSSLWVKVLKKKYGTLEDWSDGLKWGICSHI